MSNKITYVAGGGGMPAAIIHSGILWSILENNCDVVDYVGTSAGSIVGAQYAAMKTQNIKITKDNLNNIIYKDYSKFKDINISGQFKFYGNKLIGNTNIHHSGKYKGDELYKQLCKITNNLKFYDISNNINLYITATDLFTGQLIVFSKKTTPNIKLAEAVRASCSIQGIFSPYIIQYIYLKKGIFLRNSIKKPQSNFAQKYNFDINDMLYNYENTKWGILIDGGNLGNCRIDIGTNVKHQDSKLIATSFTQMNKHSDIDFQLGLLPQTIKIMMAATEKLIIKYSELKYDGGLTILRPDTLNIDTTDFDINNKIKNELFISGINEYKKIFN